MILFDVILLLLCCAVVVVVVGVSIYDFMEIRSTSLFRGLTTYEWESHKTEEAVYYYYRTNPTGTYLGVYKQASNKDREKSYCKARN